MPDAVPDRLTVGEGDREAEAHRVGEPLEEGEGEEEWDTVAHAEGEVVVVTQAEGECVEKPVGVPDWVVLSEGESVPEAHREDEALPERDGEGVAETEEQPLGVNEAEPLRVPVVEPETVGVTDLKPLGVADGDRELEMVGEPLVEAEGKEVRVTVVQTLSVREGEALVEGLKDEDVVTDPVAVLLGE